MNYDHLITSVGGDGEQFKEKHMKRANSRGSVSLFLAQRLKCYCSEVALLFLFIFKSTLSQIKIDTNETIVDIE